MEQATFCCWRWPGCVASEIVMRQQYLLKCSPCFVLCSTSEQSGAKSLYDIVECVKAALCKCFDECWYVLYKRSVLILQMTWQIFDRIEGYSKSLWTNLWPQNLKVIFFIFRPLRYVIFSSSTVVNYVFNNIKLHRAAVPEWASWNHNCEFPNVY